MNIFIHPNLHAILVHYPLAFLTFGVIAEFVSFIWKTHPLRQTGRWLILLGAILCVPALTSGMYAFRDAAQHSAQADESSTWAEVGSASNWKAVQWQFMQRHIILAAVATGIFMVCVCIWIALSQKWRERMEPLLTIVLLPGLALLTLGAWHAGESVYLFGTSVSAANPGGSVELTPPPLLNGLNPAAVMPPLQGHVIFAGLMVAMAMITLAYSINVLTSDLITTVKHAHTTFIAWATVGGLCVAALGTGIWAYQPGSVRDLIRLSQSFDRGGLHMLMGIALTLLTVLLAFLSKAAPARRLTIATLTTLLFIMLGGQVLAGSLILYDTGEGPLMSFNSAPPPAAHVSLEP